MVGADGDGGAGDSSVESPPGPGHRGRPPPGALRPTTPTTQPPPIVPCTPVLQRNRRYMHVRGISPDYGGREGPAAVGGKPGTQELMA